MYAVTAQYEHTTEDGYTGSIGVPTFYLDERVQGIMSEDDAVKVARTILTAAVREMPANDNLHISAVFLGSDTYNEGDK